MVKVCYEVMVCDIDKVMCFMDVCGVDFDVLCIVVFYVSYEVLFFEYECAFICIDLCMGDFYDVFVYFVWIGECI